MLISMTTGPFTSKGLSEKETIKLMYDAGFTAYDIGLFMLLDSNTHPFCTENAIEYAKEIRKYADELGIVCNQAHAPFHSSCGDAQRDEEIFQQIVRSIEIASVLGAKNIVVHPKQHLIYAENIDELFRLNLEFYNRLIPYCKKYNIKVAVENMFQYNRVTGNIIDSTCSRSCEFNKYIDTINSEWIVGCLDIGHVALVGADIAKFIKDLGGKRLQALHIHDNDFLRDTHTMPFIQKIDYEPIVKALSDIGYEGDMTFEANSFIAKFPKELLLPAAKLLCETGKYLANSI